MIRSHPFVSVCCGLLALLATGGCQSSQDTQAAGTLRGTVHLFDIANDTVHHAVAVWIPALGISTVSDTFGHWSLANVPFGTHDVYETSAGYDTLIDFGEIASGDTSYVRTGLIGPVSMNQVHITGVSWPAISSYLWPLTISGTVNPGSLLTAGNVVCFVDTALGVPAKGPHFINPFSGGSADTIWGATAFYLMLDSQKLRHGMKLFITTCAGSRMSMIYDSTGYGTPGMTFNTHTGQMQVVSASPLSQPYETIFP